MSSKSWALEYGDVITKSGHSIQESLPRAQTRRIPRQRYETARGVDATQQYIAVSEISYTRVRAHIVLDTTWFLPRGVKTLVILVTFWCESPLGVRALVVSEHTCLRSHVSSEFMWFSSVYHILKKLFG